MTDKEIIKALEEHIENTKNIKYGARKVEVVDAELLKDTLGCINLQQMEIESLKKAYEIYEESSGLKWAKTEAIKKFAERLKEYRYTSSDWSHGEHPMVVEWDDVENVIWELTEGNDDKV